jgi:ABC-type transport system substrate-binding protein
MRSRQVRKRMGRQTILDRESTDAARLHLEGGVMDSGRTMSRRGFLGLASTSAAGAALGVWTSPAPVGALRGRAATAPITSGPPGPGTVRGGRHGGVVHVAWPTGPNSFDAALGYNLTAWSAITCLLFTPLYAFSGQDGGPAPALAAAMPRITNGGMTYTIPLRKGAKFSNGRPIMADDYVYSWTRVLDPKVASWASSYLQPIVGSTAVMNGKSSVLSGVKALDDYTLQITLQEPTFIFLTSLTQSYAAAVPREAVKTLGKGFGTHPVGQGPFIVSSYSTANQTASFVPNPHFFWKGLPYLSGVQFHWGVNENLEVVQLERNTVQILGTGINAAQVKAEPSLRKYTEKLPSPGMAWVALNCGPGPLADARVRVALNWATDRAALSKATSGAWTAWGYPVPKGLSNYHHVASPFGYDPGRARSLLAEAGASKLAFTFLTSGGDPWTRLAQILQQQWKDVGVSLNIRTVSTSALTTISKSTPLSVGSFEDLQYMISESALTLIIPNWTSTGSENSIDYKNTTVDKLVGEAQAQTTLTGSNAYVAKIEQALVDDPPGVFLLAPGYLAGRSPSVHNFHYRSFTGFYFDRMWL